MDNASIAQKESAIAMKIKQLRKNPELWQLLSRGSCLGGTCSTQRNEDLAKVSLHHIIWYLANIDELIIEDLKKETIWELCELLGLYLEKQEICHNSEREMRT
jgi:hypothetical protein